METPIYDRLVTARLNLRVAPTQDTRDTAIVQASHAGLSTPSIMAITRLSKRTVTRILHPSYWSSNH